MEILKVSSKSNPNMVAGTLAGVINDGKDAEIQSVGAGAVNQAVKAVAIARGFLQPTGVDIMCVPSFSEVEIDGEQRTAIKLTIVVNRE